MRRNTVLPLEKLNCLFGDGGLGDNICRLSVIKYINEQCPHVKLYMWVPDYFYEFAKHVFPKNNIKKYSDNAEYDNNLHGISGSSLPQHSSLKTHLVDHAFHVMVDRQVEVEHKNYVHLKPKLSVIEHFNLPSNYVVVTTGYTAKVREFRPEIVNSVVKYIKSKGYNVVFLGNEKTLAGAAEDIIGNFNNEIDYSQGVNLINKTSLIEAHSVIAGAKTIVGLDNGLIHIAGMTDIPIIVGFTTVEARLRLPYRNNELGWNCYPVALSDKELACNGCQSKWTFIYDFDFRRCFYSDNLCTKLLGHEKYIEQLEKIL